MPMHMVLIRHFRMRVPRPFVPMCMGVSSGRHPIMPVRVVPVVVVVSISVLQRHVFMFVRVALRDQERDAEDHQQRAGRRLTAYIPEAPDRSFVNFCCGRVLHAQRITPKLPVARIPALLPRSGLAEDRQFAACSLTDGSGLPADSDHRRHEACPAAILLAAVFSFVFRSSVGRPMRGLDSRT